MFGGIEPVSVQPREAEEVSGDEYAEEPGKYRLADSRTSGGVGFVGFRICRVKLAAALWATMLGQVAEVVFAGEATHEVIV